MRIENTTWVPGFANSLARLGWTLLGRESEGVESGIHSRARQGWGRGIDSGELSFNDEAEGPRSRRRPVILVPMDLSPGAEAAAKFGMNVAQQAQGQLLLLHAVQLNLNPYGPAQLARLKMALGQEALAKTEPILICAQEKGVPAICAVEEGTPAAVITRVARRWEAELIVMTARNRQGWIACLFGGRIVEKVIRGAKCPVMVLHMDN
ncbi:MAG: UspA protein [Pedosphaera sp.]|nr:UspA protein [Pedosphaera sp.]